MKQSIMLGACIALLMCAVFGAFPLIVALDSFWLGMACSYVLMSAAAWLGFKAEGMEA